MHVLIFLLMGKPCHTKVFSSLGIGSLRFLSLILLSTLQGGGKFQGCRSNRWGGRPEIGLESNIHWRRNPTKNGSTPINQPTRKIKGDTPISAVEGGGKYRHRKFPRRIPRRRKLGRNTRRKASAHPHILLPFLPFLRDFLLFRKKVLSQIRCLLPILQQQ